MCSMTSAGVCGISGSVQSAIGFGDGTGWSASAMRIRCSRSIACALGASDAAGGRRTTQRCSGDDTMSVSFTFPPLNGLKSNGPGSPVASVSQSFSACSSFPIGRPSCWSYLHDRRAGPSEPCALLHTFASMAWDFSTEPEFQAKLDWAREFVREEIYPLEVLDFDWRQFREIAKPLQEKVKAQGLWAAYLDPELGGQGYGQVKLGLLHEILGASELAPAIFGNQAPDSGNSELIAIAGTPEQKERWMYPLLDGRLYSAFSMTEQGTGSDPKQFTTQAVRD